MTLTLTPNPLRAMAMTYSRAKVQDQRSVGSEDRMETNGRTDGGDCITCRNNAVGKYTFCMAMPSVKGTESCLQCGLRFHPIFSNVQTELELILIFKFL